MRFDLKNALQEDHFKMPNYKKFPLGVVAPAEKSRNLFVLPEKCWLLNLDQIEKETGSLNDPIFIDFSDISVSSYQFTTDHVLYSKLRPNLNKVVCPEVSGVCTSELVRLRPDPKLLLRKYLTFFLRSEHYMPFARKVVSGAKMPRMIMPKFWEYEIPLPPLAEQNCIVEILDQADALRQQRRHADELSQKIISVLFQDMFGDPLSRENPIPKKTLAELGTLVRGVSKHRPTNEPDLFNGPYPLIQTGDIANSNGLISKFSSTYSELGLAQSKLWPAGTLCVTIAANIGKTAILTFDACFPDSVVGFSAKNGTQAEYVQALFGFLQPILEMNAPSAAQKNINLKTLRELVVPAPTPELQKKFAEQVASFRASSTAQATSRATLETLFQSLLHRAFDGSLTAAWRESHAKEILQEMESQSKA